MTRPAMSDRVRHLVITRFAVRGVEGHHSVDPLSPRFLRRRIALLEVLAAPSLHHQRCRDFEWIVLVDPDLGSSARDRVRSVIGGRSNARLLDWEPSFDDDGLEWLRAHDPGQSARWYLTTHLDEDDALSSRVVEDLQRLARSLIRGDARPLHLLGCESVVQWDCVPGPAEPLGSLFAWRRALPTSAGFSALCDANRLSLSVFDFRHHLASRYALESSTEGLSDQASTNIGEVQERVETGLLERGGARNDVETVLAPGLYRRVESDGVQAVVSCHTANLRARRVFEGRSRRTTVRDATDFDDVHVDLDAARRVRADLRFRALDLIAKVAQQYRTGLRGGLRGGRLRAAAGAIGILGEWHRWSKARRSSGVGARAQTRETP